MINFKIKTFLASCFVAKYCNAAFRASIKHRQMFADSYIHTTPKEVWPESKHECCMFGMNVEKI